MRRLFAFILLLSVFCHAVAMSRQAVALDHDGEFAARHAEMHLEGTAHHHDEHGALHEDDSQASVQHMLAEAGAGAVALLDFPRLTLRPTRPPAPAITAEAAGPPPWLGGLRRPPRAFS